MLGKKYNRLTILSKDIELSKEKKRSIYKCKCDCGSIKSIRLDSIKNNHTKSCGCLSLEKFEENILNKNTLKKGESSINKHYRKYKKGAFDRGLIFKLTKEEFRDIISKNCFYCNEKPKKIHRSKNERRNGDALANGIDRLDNDKGYVLNNVVPCCTICNFMKHKLDKDEFVNQCIKISNNKS